MCASEVPYPNSSSGPAAGLEGESVNQAWGFLYVAPRAGLFGGPEGGLYL